MSRPFMPLCPAPMDVPCGPTLHPPTSSLEESRCPHWNSRCPRLPFLGTPIPLHGCQSPCCLSKGLLSECLESALCHVEITDRVVEHQIINKY